MEDLGFLARDFGIRPQGKSAPMAASRSSAPAGSTQAPSSVPVWSNKPKSGSSLEDPFSDRIPPFYEDVLGGTQRKISSPPSIDSIFDGFKDPVQKSSSVPVYDKPVYDDDIFVGIPGMRSSSSTKYVDVYGSSGSAGEGVSSPPYEDLLESLGRGMPEAKDSGERRSAEKKDKDNSEFEDLLPGFGRSSQPQKRPESEENHQRPAKPTNSMPGHPFVDLQTNSVHQSSGSFEDPLEQISRPVRSGNNNYSSVGGVVFDGLGKPVPSFPPGVTETRKDKFSYETNKNTNSGYNFGEESPQGSPVDTIENTTLKSHAIRTSVSQNSGRHSSRTSNVYEQNFQSNQYPKFHQHAEAVDDLWLTVSEIPLFTKPTNSLPPSRPPPSISGKKSPFVRADEPASPGLNRRRKDTNSFIQPNQSYSFSRDSVKSSDVSSIDELEDFAKVMPQKYPSEHAEVISTEDDIDANLRDAMGKAEAKFRHAKEVRERERDAKYARNRDYVPYQSVETSTAESQISVDREKQEQADRELLQKEMEEKEEQRKLEKERELERERERERARQAVERVTREARERAAAEAHQKAERAAADKARQQADRLAFQRASAEARERAANEAKERAEKAKVTAEREKAAAEAREKAIAEKAAAEARQRAAERAAVERVAAEARERAAAEARERAAAAAKEKQDKTDNDLEAFFGMGPRASSAPKQRAAASDNIFDAQFPSRGVPEARSSVSGSNINLKKTSSATNIAEDLSSIFGGSASPGEFQEVDGETQDRRRARLERHQRTLERAAKALAEKNERDMQMQRDQAERHRIAETLDFEIKRWAAGKEGNLRALLSTLQYVLWPESGWQPASLTDLITAAAVKKVYRKATLCIHPDKVQQKGATLQQKYIAEKVFDILKEAWNKFNSEELF